MKCFYPVDTKLGLRPCGQCQACMVNKQLQWRFRLQFEVLQADLALWNTLQYDDQHLNFKDGKPIVVKKHCQNYFRKIREYIKDNNLNVSFKYFLVAEYGPQTFRPHYHALLLFKLPEMAFDNMLQMRQEIYELCKKKWYHGHVQESLFHSGVIKYLTKYVFKTSENFDPPAPLFRLISKGIGIDYIDKCDLNQLIRDKWRTPDGVLPRYFRDKLLPLNPAFLNYQKNKDIRANIFANTLDQVYQKVKLDVSDAGSIEKYIKRQNFLLQCQKRLVEKKQKEKYG